MTDRSVTSVSVGTAESVDHVLGTKAGVIQRFAVSDFATAAGLGAAGGSAGVGFTQSGTGAVARTVQDKAREVVSVKDFGAKGDGVTDDTAAIQAAIDAVYAAGGGGVFLVGKHKITSGLQLKYAVTLWGISGQAERSSTSNKSAAGLYCSGTGYDAITIGTTSNDAMQAAVKGLSIFNAPQAGIVVNSHAAVVEGCGITFPKGSGVVLNSGVGPTLVENTHVICPGKHGMEIRGGDNRIISCEVQQPNYASVGLPANTYDCFYVTAGPLQMLNCRFGDDGYRSRAGVYFDFAAAGGGVQIIGNDFQNFTQAAIHFASGSPVNFNIIGNKFVSGSTDASKCGIRNDVAVSDLIVTGNYFNATVAGALGAFYLNATMTRCLVRQNGFTGNWATGTNVYNWGNSADRDTASDNGCDFQGPNGAAAAATVGRTLTGATPSVARGASADLFWLNNSSPTDVTDFLNGYTGQEITLLAVNSNTTVKHLNTQIRLLNNEDWTMPIYSILRLKKAASTFTFGATWYEIGRTTATAAGASGVSVGGASIIFSGTGSPETVVTAPVGCMYLRKDGGAATTLYVKESGTGNTGWTAK